MLYSTQYSSQIYAKVCSECQGGSSGCLHDVLKKVKKLISLISEISSRVSAFAEFPVILFNQTQTPGRRRPLEFGLITRFPIIPAATMTIPISLSDKNRREVEEENWTKYALNITHSFFPRRPQSILFLLTFSYFSVEPRPSLSLCCKTIYTITHLTM